VAQAMVDVGSRLDATAGQHASQHWIDTCRG
jgi:hypothetical protein